MFTAQHYTEVAARPDGGLGFELYRRFYGLTCRVDSFQGYYDIWPFCKPYDLEEWWLFLEEAEAQEAAQALTDYLNSVPARVAPQRISFIEDATGFHLTCNGEIAGGRLFRGEEDSNLWPFHRLPDWPNHATRAGAASAMLKLQRYLDGRSIKLVKAAKKPKSKSKPKRR